MIRRLAQGVYSIFLLVTGLLIYFIGALWVVGWFLFFVVLYSAPLWLFAWLIWWMVHQ